MCRYSIDRKSDVERFFNIDSSSGVIRTARRLDRETIALHNISVLATDSRESDILYMLYCSFKFLVVMSTAERRAEACLCVCVSGSVSGGESCASDLCDGR